MNERMIELYKQAQEFAYKNISEEYWNTDNFHAIVSGKFAELIVRECIDKIEAHQIPVGNSAAGEMACEWTYAALKEIRDEIKQHFGVER
jgi:hypothetical protein